MKMRFRVSFISLFQKYPQKFPKVEIFSNHMKYLFSPIFNQNSTFNLQLTTPLLNLQIFHLIFHFLLIANIVCTYQCFFFGKNKYYCSICCYSFGCIFLKHIFFAKKHIKKIFEILPKKFHVFN